MAASGTVAIAGLLVSNSGMQSVRSSLFLRWSILRGCHPTTYKQCRGSNTRYRFYRKCRIDRSFHLETTFSLNPSAYDRGSGQAPECPLNFDGGLVLKWSTISTS